MEIRELTLQDLPSLRELYVQLDAPLETIPAEKAEETWKAEIENNKYIKYFGAVDNGKVVSTCYCVIIPNLTHYCRNICFVENVVTDKNYRKQGLARKVIEAGLKFARQNNCYKAMLLSNSKRTEAHQFYENMGFSGNAKKGFVYKLSD